MDKQLHAAHCTVLNLVSYRGHLELTWRFIAFGIPTDDQFPFWIVENRCGIGAHRPGPS